MPRYMFDTEDHEDDIDDQGQELSGPAEARVQAIIYMGALLRDEPGLVWDGAEFRVRVRDEAGGEVLTVYVRAVDGPAS